MVIIDKGKTVKNEKYGTFDSDNNFYFFKETIN